MSFTPYMFRNFVDNIRSFNSNIPENNVVVRAYVPGLSADISLPCNIL